jgi:tellurite resistance protein TerC
MESIGTPFLWLMFAGVVVVALLVDLVLMRHGGPHKVTFKEATWWSLGWVALALAFNAWLWWYSGQQLGDAEGNRIGMEFLTGYLVEKSLAVDNIFVFLMIFTYFAVPEEQKRALIFGVICAIVLRALMILLGAFLIAKFHWIFYVFGAFLLITGVKMAHGGG